MEARTKIIAAVAVIMMCAAGLVGAGYAYTATTVNEGNDVTAEYVTLTQSGTGAYKFVNTNDYTVFYDEYDHKVGNDVKTEYRLNNATNMVVGGTDYSVVKLGASFTVEASKSATPEDALTVDVDITGANIANGFKLILRTVSAAANSAPVYLVYDGSAWSADNFTMGVDSGNDYYDTVVDVYYGYPANAVPTLTNHGGTAPQTQPLNNAALTFTATLDGTNANVFNVAVNGATVVKNNNLNTVTFTVQKSSGAATLDTDYKVTWRTAAGAPITTPGETAMVGGTTYIAVITGIGDCAAYQVYECSVTVPE